MPAINAARNFTNTTRTSNGPRVEMTAPVGSVPSTFANPAGAPTRATRCASLIPSFLGSGVAEYPAMRE